MSERTASQLQSDDLFDEWRSPAGIQIENLGDLQRHEKALLRPKQKIAVLVLARFNFSVGLRTDADQTRCNAHPLVYPLWSVRAGMMERCRQPRFERGEDATFGNCVLSCATA